MSEEQIFDPLDDDRRKRIQDRQEQLIRVREYDDIRTVARTPEGRRFIWRIFSMAGVFRSSYTGEAAGTFFNEGNRNIGLKLFDDLMVAKPEAFTQMQREYVSEQKSLQKQAEQEEKNGRQ